MKKTDLVFGGISLLLILLGVGTIARKHFQNSANCTAHGVEHRLNVSEDKFSTPQLVVKRCDRIIIVDTGTEEYDFAFGTHEHHLDYPGFTMQSLRPGEYFQLDAIRSGKYEFHDHLRDNAHVELLIK